MGVEGVFPRTVWQIAGVPLRNTVLHTWIIVAVLTALAGLAYRRYRLWGPSRWQLAIEVLIEYVSELVRSSGGREIPELVPYLSTLITFIAFANLLGLVPILMSPTRDLNTTLALSLISLVSCQVFGIRRRGLGRYLKSFVEPVFVILPLNILGLVSRVLSMSLRLFGNVVAGEIIGAVMFMLLPLLGPLPLTLLGVITSVLQALVFTVLTIVFVVEAMGDDAAEADSASPAHAS
ncbi:MAG: F0F1 ATP synthase subunit A [Chloroflexota bacterium]